MDTPRSREDFLHDKDYADYTKLCNDERIYYENQQKKSPYEREQTQRFKDRILLFLTEMSQLSTNDYEKIMDQCINPTEIVEIDDLRFYERIVGSHALIKQQWLSYVDQEFSQSFGGDTFLADAIIKETEWIKRLQGMFLDSACMQYLINTFGVEHDISNQEEICLAYLEAVSSEDEEGQKLLGRKFVQQLVSQFYSSQMR